VTAERPLTEAVPGTGVVLARLGSGIPVSQLEQLVSYGLFEGRVIEVLRQRPVTVILVDHTELALEPAIAAAIWVYLPPPAKRP
jgi:Fe2+ transport system protein FeoA